MPHLSKLLKFDSQLDIRSILKGNICLNALSNISIPCSRFLWEARNTVIEFTISLMVMISHLEDKPTSGFHNCPSLQLFSALIWLTRQMD